ncbi:Lysophospholipase L1 [Nocardioides terrae]|uniref:Lysophospholipase L1 n=2 Tax=Nocardioides terrae TaxID=574651 RepID=A0A1I1FSX7_9ACTN|nr:Lysophospholipase L1 [Nocardioides terrae]
MVGLAALLLLPLTLAAAPGARASDPLRILVYGDSITQGSTGDYTWRYFLDRHLRDAGVPFDLVGPRRGLHHLPEGADDDLDYAEPGFDTDHAAVWGQKLTAPVADLGDLAADHTPDVVIALIGLNDLVWNHVTPEALAERWRAEVAEVRAASPAADVVLVQVPQTWYADVPAYNAELVALSAELDGPAARVVTTALPDFDRRTDTWDGTHPTASGDLKIAEAVEAALYLAGVAPPAGMTPVVQNGPRTASSLTAEAGVGQVSLSWHDVPGVTTEWLERRDVSSGGAWDRYPLDFPAGTTSWTAAAVDGHRWEFRLRPAKGTAVSADVTSPVVSVVPGPPPAPSTAAPVVGPPLGPVGPVRARSPRRDRVRTSAPAVPTATGYRLLVAPVRSCRRHPRASAFRPAGHDRRSPSATVRARARALWVRWYAVRDGVAGPLAAASSACTRVR